MNPEHKVYLELKEVLERNPDSIIWTGPMDFVVEEKSPVHALRVFLAERVSSPDFFLGKGGAGHVFQLNHEICIKLVENRHAHANASMYDLGNTMRQEAFFQQRLRGLTTGGVRVPRVIGFWEGKKSEAMIMERLRAVNMQDVLQGKVSLPETFDADVFLDGLDDFIQDMHTDFGIAHNDLAARNIMCDVESGRPIVIDFGRACSQSDDRFAQAVTEDTRHVGVLYDELKRLDS